MPVCKRKICGEAELRERGRLPLLPPQNESLTLNEWNSNLMCASQTLQGYVHTCGAEHPLQGGHMEKLPAPLSPYPKYSFLPRTTDVQSPSIHSTQYPEGCHHMKTIFEEVEKGPLAQESMLPNKSEMKPLPPHELLVYERGSPPHHVNMSPLSDMSWTGYCLNPHIVNY